MLSTLHVIPHLIFIYSNLMGVALYFIHIINDKAGLEKLVSTIHILSKFFIFHGFSLEKDYSVNLMPSYEYTDPTGFI